MDIIEKTVYRIAIWFLRRGFGADCETCDMDDFPDTYKTPKDAFIEQRCASCRAKEVIDFLKRAIELMD